MKIINIFLLNSFIAISILPTPPDRRAHLLSNSKSVKYCEDVTAKYRAAWHFSASTSTTGD